MSAAEQFPPWGGDHGRLCSLWGFMKHTDISILLHSSWIGGISRVSHENARRRPRPLQPDKLNPEKVVYWTGLYQGLLEQCIDLDLVASTATLKKILTDIPNPKTSISDLEELVVEFGVRLQDETRSKTFLSLSIRESELYSHPRKGWEQIIERFPDVITDIEEASKCFALSRYAAAVFHSLQVVEIGLIDLSRVLVTNDPTPGWNSATRRLKAILGTSYVDRTPFQQKHSATLEQINATVQVLQAAWRNKVSHAQGKLILITREFGPEIAEEILVASRGFMRRFATEAPALPDPDA